MRAIEVLGTAIGEGSIIASLNSSISGVLLTLWGLLFGIGFVLWAVKYALGKENVNFENLIGIIGIPALAIGLLLPVPNLTRGGEGLGSYMVRAILEAGAEITDKVLQSPALGKITGGQTFTDIAKNFRDKAIAAQETMRQSAIKSGYQAMADGGSFAMEHGGITAFIGSLILGAISGASMSGMVGGPVGALNGLLVGGVSGAIIGIKYAIIIWLMGFAMDLTWRVVTLLWVIKAGVIYMLAPVAVSMGVLSFEWGFQNIGRFFINVIGIAITPLAMVGAWAGGLAGFYILSTLLDGLGTGFAGSILEFFLELLMGATFPMFMGYLLLRSGELVSYIVGVSAFAFSNINIPTKISDVMRDFRV